MRRNAPVQSVAERIGDHRARRAQRSEAETAEHAG
jgi:hypothetical protein